MNAELQRIFDEVPDDAPRSKLEPYRELILRWRRQGRSFRRIQKLLREQCSVSVGIGPLHAFVKRRSRPRKSSEPLQLECPASVVAESVKARPQRSPEEIAALRETARAANHQPVVQVKPTERVFTYDPSKPITNKKL
jgi:hypothetical protein